MARTYNIIDADGHILEPVDIWDKYIDPAYRERQPRMIVDTDGKERLLVEGKILGSPKGLGLIGGIGARQGTVDDVVGARHGQFPPCAAQEDCAHRSRSQERRAPAGRRRQASAVAASGTTVKPP